jgi:hypothetical protein
MTLFTIPVTMPVVALDLLAKIGRDDNCRISLPVRHHLCSFFGRGQITGSQHFYPSQGSEHLRAAAPFIQVHDKDVELQR